MNNGIVIKYEKEEVSMSKWVCVVCGYEEESDSVPEVCPVCGVGSEDFEEVAE